MISAGKKVKRKNNKMQTVYKVSQDFLNEFCADMSGELDYTVPCPSCTGRAFDFSGLPQGLFRVRLKCPHCKEIVETPILSVPDTS